jgi:hypothetical protein
LSSPAELSDPVTLLAAPPDGRHSSQLLTSVFFAEWAKPRDNSPRAGRRELPAVAADQALLAWLAARPAELRHEHLTTRSPLLPSECELSDAADGLEDTLDMVFEALGV